MQFSYRSEFQAHSSHGALRVQTWGFERNRVLVTAVPALPAAGKAEPSQHRALGLLMT